MTERERLLIETLELILPAAEAREDEYLGDTPKCDIARRIIAGLTANDLEAEEIAELRERMGRLK